MRIMIPGNKEKREYLLREGVVNTDMIGSFILPVGTLTSDGIKIETTLGNIGHQFKTTKAYTLDKDDILIFECTGVNHTEFAIPNRVTNNMFTVVTLGVGITGRWCVPAMLNNALDTLSNTDIFNIRGYGNNYINIVIRSIYIIRKIGGGVNSPFIKKLLKTLKNWLGETYAY